MLYFRQILIMLISLYAVRVVLTTPGAAAALFHLLVPVQTGKGRAFYANSIEPRVRNMPDNQDF
jgi:hypothetical protein